MNAAFLSAPCAAATTASKQNSTCARARRSAAGPRLMAEKEPYPGYFADLERAGVKPEDVKAKKEKKVGGKKSMYRPDGTAYAPWMVGAVGEDSDDFKIVAPKTDAKGKLAVDPQQQELSGVGLRFKVIGDDEVEIKWSTSGENAVVGFVVQRRRGKDSEWTTISDYKLNPDLKSKGAAGGDYSLFDDGVSPGSWIYRVSDINEAGAQNDLSQGLIEIEAASDAVRQKIALGVFVAVTVLIGIAGLLADPLSGL